MTNTTETSDTMAANEMIDIMSLDPTFELDIRYATDNNFTGQAVYTAEEARCILRKPVAEALVAVHADLTLITLDGSAVDMPTDYDDFSERAHPDDPEMSEHHRVNVKTLADAMARHGFTPIRTEWWHFDGPNWEVYPLQ